MQNPIKVKETELRTTSVSAWAFSAAAIFSLVCGLASLALFGGQGWLSWTTLFTAFMMALFFGYLAIVVWASVRLDTQSLALLKQEAANEVMSAQKGVWPPPPNGLKED